MIDVRNSLHAVTRRLWRPAVSSLSLMLAGCAQATASELDSRDDLHCAIAAHTVEMNMDGISTRLQRQGIFALRSWYYSKLPQERLSERPAVIEAMKADPDGMLSLVQKCVERAERDKDWDRYSKWVVQATDGAP